MAKNISLVVLAAAIGFVIYLAATGVTVSDCCRWLEYQTGVQMKKPDMKNAPHPNYMPVMPGK